jgi:hypothetical protein
MFTPSPKPTDQMAALFDVTEPLLLALLPPVAAQAVRHPDAAVPETTLHEARVILRAARRILSHEVVAPGLLELRNGCGWAALATKLALAAAAFARFKAEHRSYFPAVEGYMWTTREWDKAALAASRLSRAGNALDHRREEIADDLSM